MLNDLIRSNIRKSLRSIDQQQLKLSLCPGCPGELYLLPSFEQVNGSIVCAQVDYFGFYALRSALRGLELSTNFLAAGQRTLNDNLYGPAVVSLYTAAYHLVESLLALSDRVWIDLGDKKRSKDDKKHSKDDKKHSKDTDALSVVVGRLTRHNTWKFEKRSRWHSHRWKELRPVLLKADAELLPCFQDLFQHFFRGRYKSRTPLKSYLTALGSANPLPVGEPFSLQEKVIEFLQMIAQSRHEALYTGFGSDPLAYEAAVNGELVNGTHMAAQARALENFARGVADEVSAKLDELLGNLELSEAVKSALFFSVRFPWFDPPKYDLIQPKELAIRLKRVSCSIQPQH